MMSLSSIDSEKVEKVVDKVNPDPISGAESVRLTRALGQICLSLRAVLFLRTSAVVSRSNII
jgi:hypothetical protein